MVIGSVPEWKQDGSVGPNMELVRELRGREVQFPVIYFWRYPVIGNSCILRQIWVRQTTEHVPLPSSWPCWQALNGPQWYDIFGSSIQYALILRSYNNICQWLQLLITDESISPPYSPAQGSSFNLREGNNYREQWKMIRESEPGKWTSANEILMFYSYQQQQGGECRLEGNDFNWKTESATWLWLCIFSTEKLYQPWNWLRLQLGLV